MLWVEVPVLSLCNVASAAKVFWTLNNAPTCIKVQIQEMVLYGARWAWKEFVGRSEGLKKADILILNWDGAGSKLVWFAWLCLEIMNVIDWGGLSRASSAIRVWLTYMRYLSLWLSLQSGLHHWQVSKAYCVFLGNVKIWCLRWPSPSKDAVSYFIEHLRFVVYLFLFSF